MCENKKGDKCAINNGDCIGEFECERAKLLDEILELKEEVETRDNLSETFRKESLSWANIANECQKDKTKLERILQEIKEYINSQGIDNSWNMRIQRFRMGILDLITKAEEE
jgi:hypothetical protein